MKLLVWTIIGLLLSTGSTSGEFPEAAVWCSFLPEEIADLYTACAAIKEKNNQFISIPCLGNTALGKNGRCSLQDPSMNPSLFEGDIAGVLTSFDEVQKFENKSVEHVIPEEDWLWPGGVVFYELDKEGPVDNKSFPPDAVSVFETAIKAFHDNTCVQFKPRTSENEDYIFIASGSGCYSFPGRQSGKQKLSLQYPECMTSGIIQHQLMHVLGFFHEQSRLDRNQYVDISWGNIKTQDWVHFKNYSDVQMLHFGLDYDFDSLMHYQSNTFAIDRKSWTIRPKSMYRRDGVRMGQRANLSKSDIIKINALYDCTQPAPCPTSQAWRTFKDKCLYFSFLDNERPRSYYLARNFCVKQRGAILAKVNNNNNNNSHSMIQKLIAESGGSGGKVWSYGGKTISSSSEDIAQENTWQKYHFVCMRNAAQMPETHFSITDAV